MTNREQYTPGPANVAQIRKDSEKWALVLVKELRHSPEKSLAGADGPRRICASGLLSRPMGAWGRPGSTVKLTTVGAPGPHITETTVKRADAPKSLEYTWGKNEMRWELEALGGGTRLTLWTSIARPYIAMGAAGWQICFDVLDRLLGGTPIGRMAGPETMKFEGWQRLNAEYAQQFGVELPSWTLKPAPES